MSNVYYVSVTGTIFHNENPWYDKTHLPIKKSQWRKQKHSRLIARQVQPKLRHDNRDEGKKETNKLGDDEFLRDARGRAINTRDLPSQMYEIANSTTEAKLMYS